MNTEEYEQLLKKHDWYYEYSDDYGVCKAGRAERAELRRLANTDEKLKLLYDQYLWEWMESVR